MSDFDDEPTDEAAPADEPAPTQAAAASTRSPGPNAPATDDDWDDDWDEETGGGAKRDLTIVYAVVAAAIVIVLAIVLTNGKDDDGGSASSGDTTTTAASEIVKNWQGDVADAVGDQGADAQARATAAPGVYIWTDFWGWHVRSNRTDDVVVTVAAPQVRQKATDDYDDSDEDGGAAFKTEAVATLPAGDGSSGVGFDLGGSETATFTVTVGGQNLPAAEIFLGGAEGVAAQNPITFTKS